MTTAELGFEDARAFLSLWEGGEISRGSCFVPWPRPLASDEKVLLKIEIFGGAQAEFEGSVTFNDVDAWGQPGFVLELTQAGKLAAAEFHRQVFEATQAQPTVEEDLFATTSLFHKGSGAIERRPASPGELPETLLEPGTLLDNRFQIESHIATGGMGEVYRAVHVYLKRPIALKLLRHALSNDPDMWARFQREAELVSQLESPHVVRVFDFGKTSAEQPFLAMEFVEGCTLDLLLKQEHHLAPPRAVDLLTQLCDGLGEAHAMGIIHRDLKPANVMLSKRRDGTPIAKILDFGIARIADGTKKVDSLTQMGMVVGTPAYLAPEQALADVLDARTDIYALGCVAFELLTGKTPFDADSLQGLIAKQLNEPPVSPASVRGELSSFPGLCEAVLKALQKDRGQRFQDVRSFALALRAGVTPSPSAFDDWALPEPAAAPVEAPAPEQWPPPPPTTFNAEVQPVEARRPEGTSATGARASAPASASPVPVVSDKKRLARSFDAFALPLSPAHTQQALDRRATLVKTTSRTTLLYVEVLGAAPGSAIKGRALARVICAALDFGGTVDNLDEDALVLVFSGEAQTAPGRAMLAAIEMRETIADERRLGTGSERISIRIAICHGKATFPAEDHAYEGELLKRARGLAARTPAGRLLAERTLAALAEGVLEVREVSGLNDCVELLEPATILPAVTQRLGRDLLLAQLDKRLNQLGVGVAAPALVTGPSGSGKSTLAHELTVRARHLSAVVGMANGLRSLRGQPFGALAEMLCNVCGVQKELRATHLQRALEALKIGGSDLAAALVLGGIEQPPQPFTAGQAVAALRSVLEAGAAGRKVVFVFDGLEWMDSWSVEAFRTLCAHPAARELTIGFADRAFATENLPNLPNIDIPNLTGAEIRLWTRGLLADAAADEKLLALLVARAGGLPGRLIDWLQLLAARGWLRIQDGTYTLPDVADQLEPDQLLSARARALGPAAARLFEAACLAGDTPSSALLGAVLPDTPPAAYHRLVNSRLVRALSGRRWMPISARFAESLGAAGNPILHRRLAQALLDEAKSANVQPEAALLADHLSRGGDITRALPLWRQAAESALTRRAPRDLLVALKGWADALRDFTGNNAFSADAIRARADSLARASAIALVIGDATAARSLAEEAEQLAAAGEIESAEIPLAMARVLRSEARRSRAVEALAVAEKRAGTTPVLALCLVERGEAREFEGDLAGAAEAFQKALSLADAARDFARWHGEIDLRSRIEARLGGVRLAQKDFVGANKLFVAALAGWRKTGWAWGESRVLSNLGALKAQASDFVEAARWFTEAVVAGARCGDLLFQSRTLLNLARAERKTQKGSEKASAQKAKRIAVLIGWEDGRKQADSMLTG